MNTLSFNEHTVSVKFIRLSSLSVDKSCVAPCRIIFKVSLLSSESVLPDLITVPPKVPPDLLLINLNRVAKYQQRTGMKFRDQCEPKENLRLNLFMP